MLEVRDVVQIAKRYIAEVFYEDGGDRPLLEEVRHNQGRLSPWEVVVSIAPPPEVFGSISAMERNSTRRLKKVFIDDNGNVTDVQMYNL